ncbi:hypothetical protein V1477_011466 [Vespula maculifrons]|uniref:Uncharacterized protein n=1 Tax=Vespula maculifrons TaxID=7453 RepID=A0ABD2BZ97_VESMC
MYSNTKRFLPLVERVQCVKASRRYPPNAKSRADVSEKFYDCSTVSYIVYSTLVYDVLSRWFRQVVRYNYRSGVFPSRL